MTSVVIFYDYFTPAFKAGGPIRSIQNLIELTNDQIKYYIITSNRDHDESRLKVVNNQWVSFDENVDVAYLSKSHQNLQAIKMLLKGISFDLIYINGVFSMFTTILPLRLAHKVQPVLIAPRGMLQSGALTIKPFKKRIYLFLLKQIYLARHQNLHWQATDAQEALDISKMVGNTDSTTLVGNIPAYTKNSSANAFVLDDKIRLVSISLLARMKNHLFFLKLLNQVRCDRRIIYDIYGPQSDPSYYEELVKLSEQLPDHISVNFMGDINPAEVNSTLKQYHYYILPTLGENFGHSIFESFNVGLPVIISDQTPWTNLATQKAGWELPLKEKVWINQLNVAFNIEEAEYLKLRMGARKIADDYMSKSNLKENYLELFQHIIEKKNEY